MHLSIPLSAAAFWALSDAAAIGARSYHDLVFRGPEDASHNEYASSLQERQAEDCSSESMETALRILPLGASTMFGLGTFDGNGFRRYFRDALRCDGWDVNMVGSRSNGTMKDSDNEATSGFVIDESREALQKSLPYKPNVVIINCGTNDASQGIDIPKTHERMSAMLHDIWDEDGMGDTCVLLSTLNKNGADEEADERRRDVNEQYRKLADDLRDDEGKCIYVADMDPTKDDTYIPGDLIPDNIHPNDEGNRRMARIFYEAFKTAHEDRGFAEPAEVSNLGEAGCDKEGGSSTHSGGLTQQGSGEHDGIYYHDSEEKGVELTITADEDRNQFRFAALYGRDRHDLLEWFEDGDGHKFGLWKNNGDGNFDKIDDLDPDLFCREPGVNFIDMNGDGLDDLVCVGPEGDLSLSINQGDGGDDKPPSFKGQGVIKENEGYGQDRVRLADIDGDGRGDLCALDDEGNVHCWRNAGVDDDFEKWEALGQRFDSKDMGDAAGVRFADINGDGRDDWLWVDDVGKTTTYTNSRSCKQGKEGDGLNVAWRQGFLKGKDEGATHVGMGEYGDKGLRKRVHFARVYGEPEVFGLLPPLDYVFFDHSEDDGEHKFEMRVWKSKGQGAAKPKADGNRYCKMADYGDSREDYVWVHSTGKMRIFFNNQARKTISGDQSFWGKNEDIWNPRDFVDGDLDRRDLHLADWDGDGSCDIIWTDPEDDNKVSVWINKWADERQWAWDHLENPAEGLSCSQRRGLGVHDQAVRFADIDGNGYADYLCLAKDGTVHAHLHTVDDTWHDAGQVKFSEGADRADLRFADVNGDGLADLIIVDKFSGDASVSYNRGPGGSETEEDESSFRWDGPKHAFDGSYAGTCQYFPDLDGNGRADLHSIKATFDNTAETWFSDSCGLDDRQGDDTPQPIRPELPPAPGEGDN